MHKRLSFRARMRTGVNTIERLSRLIFVTPSNAEIFFRYLFLPTEQ